MNLRSSVSHSSTSVAATFRRTLLGYSGKGEVSICQGGCGGLLCGQDLACLMEYVRLFVSWVWTAVFNKNLKSLETSTQKSRFFFFGFCSDHPSSQRKCQLTIIFTRATRSAAYFELNLKQLCLVFRHSQQPSPVQAEAGGDKEESIQSKIND